MGNDDLFPGGVARRRLNTGPLAMILISASGPMTVLVGSLVTTFAVTGNVGTALAYPILAAMLALFSVGYAAMSRHVLSAGGFYPYVALGLGRCCGVASSFVAVVAYSAVQIGLFGLFGVVAGDFFRRQLGLSLPWWAWSGLVLAVVAALGIRKIDLSAKVLACLLCGEIAAMVLFDAGSLARPAGGSVSLAGLDPHNLLQPGFGVVFAFAIAGYLGFEQGAVYSEEVRDPERTVAGATFLAVAVTGLLYTVTAWALTVGVGPYRVVARARDTASDLPFSLMALHFGGTVAMVANALLVTGVFACMLSIHNCVARYLFAMSRDHILPSRLVLTGRSHASPVTGSLMQSAASAVVVGAFAVVGLDPIVDLFTWLSYISAVGVLLLLAATSAAVVGFFRRRPELSVNLWRTRFAPLAASAVLVALAAVVVANAGTVLGTGAGSPVAAVLTGLVAVSAVGGLVYAAVFRANDPTAYAGIGANAVRLPLAVADPLADTSAGAAGWLDAVIPGIVGDSVVATVGGPMRSRWCSPSARARNLARRLRALHTVRRLWPLWRQISAAVPEVALLPRYHGLAALRSVVRHAPLVAIRMPVEILDGYAALAPWMSARAHEVAEIEADRRQLRDTDHAAAVEAAVLAVALYTQTGGTAPDVSLRKPAGAAASRNTPFQVTINHLARIGRELHRSPVVSAVLRDIIATPSAGTPDGKPDAARTGRIEDARAGDVR